MQPSWLLFLGVLVCSVCLIILNQAEVACLIVLLVCAWQTHKSKGKQHAGFYELKLKLNALVAEVTPTLNEIEQSIDDIYATQQDAANTLHEAFSQLRLSFEKQTIYLENALQGNVNKEESEQFAQQSKTALNLAIRGLQFEDINGQHLLFIKETLSFMQLKLASVNESNVDSVIADFTEHLSVIKKRKDRIHNPVSASNMNAGDIDLF